MILFYLDLSWNKLYSNRYYIFQLLKDKFLDGESIFEVPSSRYKPVHNIDSDEEDLSSDDGGNY